VYAAFAARDWEGIADLCEPDLDYETRPKRRARTHKKDQGRLEPKH
jgi:hypothetical protein